MKKQNEINELSIDSEDSEFADLSDYDSDEEEISMKADDYFTIIKNHEIITNPADALKNVIGLQQQKEELLNVINWFKNAEHYQSRGVNIPKGIVLFGDIPGNGKSLLIKEIIKMIDVPVILFNGGDRYNLINGLSKAFKTAKSIEKAIIVIDEIDLLICNDSGIIRCLQDNLDGMESSNNILVLCATNNINVLPQALRRNGRLEKLIEVACPEADDALKLFKFYFEKTKMKFDERVDEEELGFALEGNSCVTIQAIVNDIALRNDFKNITKEKIFFSINQITKKVVKSRKPIVKDVCIHEASHACMAYKYKDFVRLDKLNVDGNVGMFISKRIYEPSATIQRAIADIQISMAGIIGQKLLCKDYSIGSQNDLDHARNIAYNLFNCNGYSSCWETLPGLTERSRTETSIKRRRMERKIEKFLKIQERKTYMYLRKHLKQINVLADLLFEKKILNSNEIMECLSDKK